MLHYVHLTSLESVAKNDTKILKNSCYNTDKCTSGFVRRYSVLRPDELTKPLRVSNKLKHGMKK